MVMVGAAMAVAVALAAAVVMVVAAVAAVAMVVAVAGAWAASRLSHCQIRSPRSPAPPPSGKDAPSGPARSSGFRAQRTALRGNPHTASARPQSPPRSAHRQQPPATPPRGPPLPLPAAPPSLRLVAPARKHGPTQPPQLFHALPRLTAMALAVARAAATDAASLAPVAEHAAVAASAVAASVVARSVRALAALARSGTWRLRAVVTLRRSCPAP